MKELNGSDGAAAVTTSFAVRNFVDKYYPELKDQIIFSDSKPDSIGKAAVSPLSAGWDFMDGQADCCEMEVNDKPCKIAFARNLGQTRMFLEMIKEGSAPADIVWLNA